MSDVETRLRDLLHDTAPGPVPSSTLVDGARRYAVRARRVRLAAVAATLAAVLGLGGAVASGAFRDRTLSPARPTPTTRTPSLPPGPSWRNDLRLTDSRGNTFTLSIAAVITKAGSSGPDAQDRTKRLFTTPAMGGYYTLTNDTAVTHDLGAPVQLLAYWKVPAGYCSRYNSFIALGHWPVPRVSGGQELCPMAAGDSTLPSTPLSMPPRQPVLVPIDGVTIGADPGSPLTLSAADAATAVRVTRTPPVGWLAFDEDFSTGGDSRVASSGMPAP